MIVPVATGQSTLMRLAWGEVERSFSVNFPRMNGFTRPSFLMCEKSLSACPSDGACPHDALRGVSSRALVGFPPRLSRSWRVLEMLGLESMRGLMRQVPVSWSSETMLVSAMITRMRHPAAGRCDRAVRCPRLRPRKTRGALPWGCSHRAVLLPRQGSPGPRLQRIDRSRRLDGAVPGAGCPASTRTALRVLLGRARQHRHGGSQCRSSEACREEPDHHG